MRGEQKSNVPTSTVSRGSPPLARGTVFNGVAAKEPSGITPACAGNRTHLSLFSGIGGDHPRLRGEQIPSFYRRAKRKGSPPLARGTVLFAWAISCGDRITPACAGNSNLLLFVCGGAWDHPRLRGEQDRACRMIVKAIGSPPLARGTDGRTTKRRRKRGITPACAGNRLKKDLLYLVFYNIVFHFSISFS